MYYVYFKQSGKPRVRISGAETMTEADAMAWVEALHEVACGVPTNTVTELHHTGSFVVTRGKTRIFVAIRNELYD